MEKTYQKRFLEASWRQYQEKAFELYNEAQQYTAYYQKFVLIGKEESAHRAEELYANCKAEYKMCRCNQGDALQFAKDLGITLDIDPNWKACAFDWE